MDEKQFWEIIRISRDISIDNEDFVNKAKNELLKFSEKDIIEFEAIFRKSILDLEHYNIEALMYLLNGYVSDDSYLYFRCWLISLGKEIYIKLIKQTDEMLEIFKSKNIEYEDNELEEFLYLSTDAFEEKTGKEEDDTFPRDICFERGLDYDFNDNAPKGDDWEEEDLPKRFPKLYKYYKEQESNIDH